MNCWVKREKLFVKIENAHSKYTHPFTISMAHTRTRTVPHKHLTSAHTSFWGATWKLKHCDKRWMKTTSKKTDLAKVGTTPGEEEKNLWSDKSLKPKWWLIVANVRSLDLIRKMTNYPFICKCPKEMERKKRMVFSAFPTS